MERTSSCLAANRPPARRTHKPQARLHKGSRGAAKGGKSRGQFAILRPGDGRAAPDGASGLTGRRSAARSSRAAGRSSLGPRPPPRQAPRAPRPRRPGRAPPRSAPHRFAPIRATRPAPTASAEPLSVWARSPQSLRRRRLLAGQLRDNSRGLAVKKVEKLDFQRLIAQGLARQMHEIDRRLVRPPIRRRRCPNLVRSRKFS